MYHKPRISAKIGTHSSTQLVLWDDKQKIEKGCKILAMEANLYDSLHSQYRRLKSCQYWETYKIEDVGSVVFVSK